MSAFDYSAAGLWSLPAQDLLRGYSTRAFSPVEVVTELLDRIDELNPVLRSYLSVDHDGAIGAARRAEQIWSQPGSKPVLCGVPVSLKDTIEMAGLPTTYGSLAFKSNHQPDSEIARRLRGAGAVLLGKTNTPEFALQPVTVNRLGDPAVNPWCLDRTPGGSSGGAASAVAAGLGPIAIGTDSGGSIRGPAAYTGIFGFKPTFQRIPTVQTWRAAFGRSHNGPLTRTVGDAALLMTAIAGPDTRDPESQVASEANYFDAFSGSIRNARVAVSSKFGFAPPLEEEVLALFKDAVELVTGLGCDMELADPPSLEATDEVEPGVWAYASDHYAAAEEMVPGFWDTHQQDLTDYAYPIYAAGRTIPAWKFRRITVRNARYVSDLAAWFRKFDYLLAPATGAAPLVHGTTDKKGAHTALRTFGFLSAFSVGHHPAAAVPVGFDANGLPIGVQIVGPLGDDVGVLRMAAAMEAARPWSHSWPSIAQGSEALTSATD